MGILLPGALVVAATGADVVCGSGVEGLVNREGRVALSVFLLIPVGEEW